MEQQLFMQITLAHVLWPRHIHVSVHSIVRSLACSLGRLFFSFISFYPNLILVLMFFKYSLSFIRFGFFVWFFIFGMVIWWWWVFSLSRLLYCCILLLSCSFDFGSFHFSMLLKQRFFLFNWFLLWVHKGYYTAASTYDMDYDRLLSIISLACPAFCLIQKKIFFP